MDTEEAMLFPMVHARTRSAPSELVDDHATLTRAIANVEDTLAQGERAHAKEAILAFDAILIAHLDREEALVVPVLLQHLRNVYARKT